MDRFGRVPVIAVGFVVGVDRLLARRARDAHRLDRRRDRGLRAGGRGGRRRAARAHRGRRHVPARAPRARDLVRPLRLRLRRDPRAGSSSGRSSPARSSTPDALTRAVARRGGPRARRARDRLCRPAGPEEDRRAIGTHAERAAADRRRAAERDPPPARRHPGDARGGRELRRDGLGDEPHRATSSSSTTTTRSRTSSRSSARTSSACTRSCSSSAPLIDRIGRGAVALRRASS